MAFKNPPGPAGREYVASLDHNEIVRLYVNEKMSLKSLGRQYGVSDRSIKTILIKKGVAIRKHLDAARLHNQSQISGEYFPCKYCGTETYKTKKIIERFSNKYCSIDCFLKDIANRPERICIQCSNAFEVAGYLLNRTPCIFCSTDCYHQYQKDHMPYICFVCDNCGQEFKALSYRRYRDGNQRVFCSDKCSQEFKVGENNNQWKGGISSLSCRVRKSSKYMAWKSAVRKRDNYTCQDCLTKYDKYSPDLHVHHIIGLAQLLGELAKKYPDLGDYELFKLSYKNAPLWDLNNAVCLCLDCHARAHSKNPLQEQEKN